MDVNCGVDAYSTNKKTRLRDLDFSSKEVFLSISMFVVGFLYWEITQFWDMGAGVTVFAFTITILTTVYLSLSGFKQTRYSIICNALIYVSSLNFLIFDSGIEKVFNMLWLMLLYIYWVALFTGRTVEKRTSVYTIGDMVRQIVITPFANFTSLFVILVYKKKKEKNGRRIISGLMGFLVFLPVLILVIALLSSVDNTFGAIFDELFDFEPEQMPIYIQEFILGIPVAMYLCGLIIGNSKNRYASWKKESLDRLGRRLAFASNAAINTALAAFCIIYIIFFAAQLVNLIGSIGGGLPDNLTYAQYARKGFFQLCFVTGINLGICTVTYTFVKSKTSRMFRILVGCMSLATILLGATAMSKMILYIKYFGLTQLRVYVSWFMILLMLIFAVVLIRQIRKFNATSVIAIIFTVCFMALTFGNVDGQIAKYNMARYEAGTLEMMDSITRDSLSYAAMPYICEAYKNADDKEIKETLYNTIAVDHGGRPSGIERSSSWKSFNFQKAKGERLQKVVLNTPNSQQR